MLHVASCFVFTVHTDVAADRKSSSGSTSHYNEHALRASTEFITSYVEFASHDNCMKRGCHFFHIREEETNSLKLNILLKLVQCVSGGVGDPP